MTSTQTIDSFCPPFGMVMPGRNWVAGSASGYGFGFNGKLKDDEIMGSANSYDFGARIYDVRLGRWSSLDPLSKTYNDLSGYSFGKNNPIIYIDPDGRKIEFANKDAKKLYKSIKKTADDETKAKLSQLEKTDIVFLIQYKTTTQMSNPAQAGETSYNFDESRVEIDINSDIPIGRQVGALGDELETSNQYLTGKLGLRIKADGTSGSIGYDRIDEANSQRAAIKAQESLGYELDESQKNFKKLDSEGNSDVWFTTDPVGKNYSKLPTSETTSTNNFANPGQTVSETELDEILSQKNKTKGATYIKGNQQTIIKDGKTTKNKIILD